MTGAPVQDNKMSKLCLFTDSYKNSSDSTAFFLNFVRLYSLSIARSYASHIMGPNCKQLQAPLWKIMVTIYHLRRQRGVKGVSYGQNVRLASLFFFFFLWWKKRDIYKSHQLMCSFRHEWIYVEHSYIHVTTLYFVELQTLMAQLNV